MHVRDYTPADRDPCLAVFDSNIPTWFLPHEREEFATFLDTPLPGPYLVLVDEAGTVAGCGGYAMQPGTRDVVLCWGMVDRTRHGTGLGRLLLDERLARVRADRLTSRIASVELHTSQHTRGFYERRGFVLERLTPDGYGPGLDRCDMRLVLG